MTLVGTTIVCGPESYYFGVALGLRYDFVQPRAFLVPFIEMRGGPGDTDARGIIYSQQENLTFTYLFSAGLRCDLSSRWSVSMGALDQHLSNGYLGKTNYGVDSLGVSVGIFTRF